MKAKTFKKVTSLALVGAMTASLFAGCGSDSSKSSTAKNSKHGGPYEDFITVDVYDSQANFQGIQSGWFAKVVKDTVLTFWTFDIFHEGHKNYLFNAKKYWDKLHVYTIFIY